MMTEKESCITMIQKIVDLRDKVRTGGILALEENAEQEQNFFLKTGLYLLVDGVDHENTKQVMQALYKAYHFMGSTARERLIITYGILMIQTGFTSKQIEDFLNAMPDEKLIQQIEEKMSADYEAMIKNAPSYAGRSVNYESALPNLYPEEIEAIMNIKSRE